jgi:hypothetical protein
MSKSVPSDPKVLSEQGRPGLTVEVSKWLVFMLRALGANGHAPVDRTEAVRANGGLDFALH